MKTILFHQPELDNNRIFSPNSFGFNDPFIFLKERLSALGYELITSDNHPVENCSWVIFLNNSQSQYFPGKTGIKSWLRRQINNITGEPRSRDIYKECLDQGFGNVAMILWDNDVICPGNFSPELHKRFPKVFTWNDRLVDGKKFIKFYPPVPREIPAFAPIPFSDKKLLVNISRNRYSSDHHDLYRARRKTIRYFEKHHGDNFDLFGIGWNKPVGRLQKMFPGLAPRYASYKGPVETKAEVMSRYKFSVCYENLSGEMGYISEKIFDGMRCGTIPIYWGAENAQEYIEADAFIDRRLFSSDKELASFLINMTEEEYVRRQNAINSFLNGERFARFLPENFADTIIKNLNL